MRTYLPRCLNREQIEGSLSTFLFLLFLLLLFHNFCAVFPQVVMIALCLLMLFRTMLLFVCAH